MLKVSTSLINVRKYYGENKFALWVDFRATKDNDLHGVSKEQHSNQEIKMEVSKINMGDGEYTMHKISLPTLKL